MNSLLSKNLYSNIIGKIWTGIISLAIIPIYINFLGIESYALVGIFLTIFAIVSVLDFGLGGSINYYLAKLSANEDSLLEMCNLIRTLEIIFWCIGILIALIIYNLSPFLSSQWIKPNTLSQEYLEETFKIMSIVIACQWPRAFYYSGITGLQKHLVLNLSSIFFSTTLNIGGVIILWLISPTIQALLIWYFLVGLIESLTVRLLLINNFPNYSSISHFSIPLLFKIRRFAVGTTGISIVSIILTQMDKVILSNLISLEEFGYYNIAWRVSSILYYLIGPVNTSFFPKFCQLINSKEYSKLIALYHTSNQLLIILILPITSILYFYSFELIFLWTNNTKTAYSCAPIISILAIGTAINGIISLPSSLKVAHGSTKLLFTYNIVAVVLICPITYIFTIYYGAIGAAWAWLLLNFSYLIIFIPLIHKNLFIKHMWKWYINDVGFPSFIVILISFIFISITSKPITFMYMIFDISILLIVLYIVAMLAAPIIRKKIFGKFLNF